MAVCEREVVSLTVNPLLVNAAFGVAKGREATVDQVSVRITIRTATSFVSRLVDAGLAGVWTIKEGI